MHITALHTFWLSGPNGKKEKKKKTKGLDQTRMVEQKTGSMAGKGRKIKGVDTF